MHPSSSNTDPYFIEMIMRWDCEYWYSYVVAGFRNEIEHNTRKAQRTMQRKFCNAYSRLQRFRADYPELFI